MRILSLGLHLWGDRAHLARYESQRGHEVRHLAIRGDAHYHFAPEETATEVVDHIGREWQPDLFLCTCPEMHPPPLEMEHCPIRSAAIVSDWNLYHPQLLHNLARYDVVICDRLGSQVLKLEGATPRFFQPLYAHRPLIHRRMGLARNLDILFLGNLNHAIHRRRGKVLEQVADLADEFTVEIAGGFPPEEYARKMNTARIVVNHAVRREMNLRCFEAPACGALLFQEEDNLEAHDWLADEREAVYYTPENIVDRLRYYLGHEEERARIAEAGCRRVNELAPEHRMDDLFDWIAAQPMGARKFTTFPAKTRDMADLMLIATSQDGAHAALLWPRIEQLGEKYGADPGVLVARGSVALHLAGSEPERYPGMSGEALRCFHEATSSAPEEAVPWLCLARVARGAGKTDLERNCLERALLATRANHGAFLPGRVSDACYADWRLAMATGDTGMAIPHATAALRLAELLLGTGDPAAALVHAKRSLELHPADGTAHRFAAIAHSQLGDLDEAASLLEAGFPLTAFDMAYRLDLVRVRDALGQRAAARELALESCRLCRACPSLATEASSFEPYA